MRSSVRQRSSAWHFASPASFVSFSPHSTWFQSPLNKITEQISIVVRYMFIGLPAKDVPLEADHETAFKWGYAMGVVYNPILALTKLSVLMFILRFSGVIRGVRYFTWSVVVFNTAQMVAMFTVVVFQCIPFEKNWNSLLEGRCVNTLAFTFSTSALTIFTDIVSIALPLYILAGLQMNSRKKIGLMIVFGFGIL